MMWAPETIDIATWPAVYAVLAPALVQSGETVTELIDLLLENKNQLWVLRKGGDPVAVAVSELIETPLGLVAHGRLLAGENMETWVGDAIYCIAQHAKEAGAVAVEIDGRKGWERLLKPRGWKLAKVTMRMDLEKV